MVYCSHVNRTIHSISLEMEGKYRGACQVLAMIDHVSALVVLT